MYRYNGTVKILELEFTVFKNHIGICASVFRYGDRAGIDYPYSLNRLKARNVCVTVKEYVTVLQLGQILCIEMMPVCCKYHILTE